MKILIIDDQNVPAESLRLAIEQGIPGSAVLVHEMFDTAFARVEQETPDAIVLDIYLNQALDQTPGNEIQDRLWKEHFCPLVIYTAKLQDRHRTLAATHPFIQCEEKKGSADNDKNVIEHLKGFSSHVATLRAIRLQAVKAIGNSLRAICPEIWTAAVPDADRAELIGRIARRHVAASMDASATSENPLHPWEQFVYPPICPDLLTGDILLDTTSGSRDAKDFRVVISPSCDLVRNRKGCADRVLVAICESVDTFLKALGYTRDTNKKTLAKQLPFRLHDDQVAGVFCLPEFPGILPIMAVNLKKIALIDIRTIEMSETGTLQFRRVASLDSPFRERVAWAYTEIASRPGIPDINVNQMAETLIASITTPIATVVNPDA